MVAACSFSICRETWRVRGGDGKLAGRAVACLRVVLCLYVPLHVYFCHALCVSACGGGLPGGARQPARWDNGETRSVQTKALARLLFSVSHCQSCRTPPAHRLPLFSRDYSCICLLVLFFSCLLTSQCCFHVGEQISWSMCCHSNEWLQKSLLVTVLILTLVLDHVYGNYCSVQCVMFGFCVLFCLKTCLKAWVFSYSTHNQTRGRHWGGDGKKAQWSRWGGSQRWGRFWIGGAHDWQPKQLTRCWARDRSAEWHRNKTAKW